MIHDKLYAFIDTDAEGSGTGFIFGHPPEDLANARIVKGPEQGDLTVHDGSAAWADAGVSVSGAAPRAHLIVELTLPEARQVALMEPGDV